MIEPGIKNKTFYILLDGNYFRKKDIIQSSFIKLIVLKVYKPTWWRKILNKLGFKVKMLGLKVKTYNEPT